MRLLGKTEIIDNTICRSSNFYPPFLVYRNDDRWFYMYLDNVQRTWNTDFEQWASSEVYLFSNEDVIKYFEEKELYSAKPS